MAFGFFGDDLPGELMRDGIDQATGQGRFQKPETVYVQDETEVQRLKRQLKGYDQDWKKLVRQRDEQWAEREALEIILMDIIKEHGLDVKVIQAKLTQEYNKKIAKIRLDRRK